MTESLNSNILALKDNKNKNLLIKTEFMDAFSLDDKN